MLEDYVKAYFLLNNDDECNLISKYFFVNIKTVQFFLMI